MIHRTTSFTLIQNKRRDSGILYADTGYKARVTQMLTHKETTPAITQDTLSINMRAVGVHFVDSWTVGRYAHRTRDKYRSQSGCRRLVKM